METENTIIVGIAGMQYQFDENSDIGKKIIEKLIPGAGILLIREKGKIRIIVKSQKDIRMFLDAVTMKTMHRREISLMILIPLIANYVKL